MALLFTDVVDSTHMNARVGDERARRAWAEHDQRARELLRAWRGREVGRSDGFLILFASCDDALGFALDYHRALAALELPFAARVGAHWGPVILRHNSAADVAAGATPFEVDGLALPTAARVMSAAQGAQTLFSGVAARLLSPTAMRGRQSRAHGFWRLKGLDEPIELFGLAAADATLAPPPDSPKAYQVLERDGLWLPVAAVPNNLGPEPDPFIGRNEALHALSHTLDGGARLVTLLGIGGIGKTRLAQRYARGWLGGYPGGAWFCDLAAARGTDGIVHAVAQALDVPLGRADPVQQLTIALAARGECLVVLDNFEQVARCAEATLGVWLRALPAVRFLVTSRELLALPGEQVQLLAPLSSDEACDLFRQRMQAAGIEEELTEVDDRALAPLVELLDRLPLAIELAAARARVVPPADQVQRMGERFRLLASRGGRHDRQATLRATLDWSWELLLPAEQSALAQLSVFESGFTLGAAEAVVELRAAPDSPWVADVLQSLVQKSLVRRVHARRFDLLRSVQDYARERLAALEPAAADRHWHYFAHLSETNAIADRCVEVDNLAIACHRATAAEPAGAAAQAQAHACAVGALVNAWAALRLLGPFRAALDLAAPLALRTDLPAGDQALVQRVLGGAAGLMGQAEAAREHYARGLALARDAGRWSLQAQLQCLLADLDILAGRLDEAEAGLAAAEAIAADDAAALLMLDNARGNLAMARSDHAAADVCYGRALTCADALRERRWQGGLHGSLGAVAISAGQLARARHHFEQALSIANELGDRQWAGNARCNLGLLLHQMGEQVEARAELQGALHLAQVMGHRRLEATVLCNLGLVTQALEGPAVAVDHFERAVAVAQALQSWRMEGHFRGYLGEALGRLGRAEAALACLDQAQTLLQPGDDGAGLALLLCQRASAAAHLGQPEIARKALAEANALAAGLVVAADSELDAALHRAAQDVSLRC